MTSRDACFDFGIIFENNFAIETFQREYKHAKTPLLKFSICFFPNIFQ